MTKEEVEKFGIKTNNRVILSADAYFQALKEFFEPHRIGQK